MKSSNSLGFKYHKRTVTLHQELGRMRKYYKRFSAGSKHTSWYCQSKNYQIFLCHNFYVLYSAKKDIIKYSFSRLSSKI